jgi:hypothetical protein
MADKNANIEAAKSQQQVGDYANVAGGLLNDYNNSQKQDVVFKNKFHNLGNAPRINEADRPAYQDRISGITGRNLAQANADRAQVDNQFKTDMAVNEYAANNAKSAAANDPMSEESAQAREYLKRIVPSAAQYPGIDRMSAAQLEKVTPGLYKAYNDAQELKVKQNMTGIAAKARQDAITDKQDQKNQTLYIPGIGHANNDMDAKTVKTAAELKDKFDRALNEMIGLREKHNGGAILDREDVGRGKQLSNELLLTYKDLAKLGVLSISDEKILKAIIPEDPLAYSGAGLMGQDPIRTNLEGLKNDANKDYEKALSLRLKSRDKPTVPPMDENMDLSVFKKQGMDELPKNDLKNDLLMFKRPAGGRER